jgi:hypothetical protein
MAAPTKQETLRELIRQVDDAGLLVEASKKKLSSAKGKIKALQKEFDELSRGPFSDDVDCAMDSIVYVSLPAWEEKLLQAKEGFCRAEATLTEARNKRDAFIAENV